MIENMVIPDKNKVCYLTIKEQTSEQNSSRSKARGIFTEIPGFCSSKFNAKFQQYRIHSSPVYTGGIYLASNVSNSFQFWNCAVHYDRIGKSGDCTYLREFLPPEKKMLMEKNRVYWFTDRTPREELPIPEGEICQTVQIFASDISVWLRDYFTQNEECAPGTFNVMHGNSVFFWGVGYDAQELYF